MYFYIHVYLLTYLLTHIYYRREALATCLNPKTTTGGPYGDDDIPLN